MLKQSFGQLKQVQERFMQNIASLTIMKSSSDDPSPKFLMVPITTSVYVHAESSVNDKVLVDIGTGYFIEKSLKDADEYYTRKIRFLHEQLQKIEKIIIEKSKNLSLITQEINNVTSKTPGVSA